MPGRPRKWTDNPMVPLMPERLRAAMDVRGWGADRVAKEIVSRRSLHEAIQRQNVHHLISHKAAMTRCRARRRAALARVLEAPEEWLAGEWVELPLVARYGMLRLSARTPRAALALQRLLTECDKAVRRDIAARRVSVELAPTDFDPVAGARESVLDGVYRLCIARDWRTQLGTRFIAPHRPIDTNAEPLSADDDEAILGAVRALHHVLAPWLDRDAPLNYWVLGELVRFLFPITAMLPNAMLPPGIKYRVWKDRQAVRDPTHPFAFVLWPARNEELPSFSTESKS